MGQIYDLKCAQCNYKMSVMEGIGFAYSPHAVFYGRCDDLTQRFSIAFPDGLCEDNKPLLISLVKSKRIRETAFRLLSSGATTDYGYGHELYLCPQCNRPLNKFYFKLQSDTERYEPDYHCPRCEARLRRVRLKRGKNGQSDEFFYKNNRKAECKCPKCGCGKIVYGDNFARWD